MSGEAVLLSLVIALVLGFRLPWRVGYRIHGFKEGMLGGSLLTLPAGLMAAMFTADWGYHLLGSRLEFLWEVSSDAF